MAFRKRASVKKPRRRMAGKRVARKRAGKPATQYATIKETIEFKDLAPNTAYSLLFNLSQFSRASALAKNFRFYKAMKVEWALEPLYNIYYDNATGDTVPYLYKVMDRTQDTLGITLQDIQGMGAKPIKLVSKKTFTFTPNWCSGGLTTYVNNEASGAIARLTHQGMRAEYSYLASPNDSNLAPDVPQYLVPADTAIPAPASGMNAINTNQVTYNGMDLWIDQSISAGNPLIARCTATVTWSFKDAKFSEFVRDPAPLEPKVLEV